MRNHFYKNRGMYTEMLVDQTIAWYASHQIAFFRKNYIPVTISNVNQQSQVQGQITQHAGVDYVGLYQGRYFCFEVKETDQEYFLLKQLKETQLTELEKINYFQGISFLLLNFNAKDKIFIIPTNLITCLKHRKVGRIRFDWAQKHCLQVPIQFPGIIDWIKSWVQNQDQWSKQSQLQPDAKLFHKTRKINKTSTKTKLIKKTKPKTKDKSLASKK